MRFRKIALIFFLILILSPLLGAKNFWDQSYERWNRGQVVTMLSHSPWAQDQNIRMPIQGINSGINGEKEVDLKFTVRFFSALPIREAYVRMAELMNNYDEMTPDQRQAFTQRFSRALKLDVSGRVIVAAELSTNVAETDRDLKRYFATASADTLKQNVYLITPEQGRVQLTEYYPPSNDGTGAKFIFPRQMNGKALVQPGDKQITLELYVPPVNQNLRVDFKVAEMSYQGELSY